MNEQKPAAMGEYNVSVTGWTGFEDEILRLRNANRSVTQDRLYLEWRYGRRNGAPEPIVFWVKSQTGEAVGMASLIFRPFSMDRKEVYIGVLGDISLDESLRGKGIGRRLLEYVRRYLTENLADLTAIVIPNEAARKSLISAGWTIEGNLVPYALPFAPVGKLTRTLRSEFLARCLSGFMKRLVLALARFQTRKGYTMRMVSEVDTSFDGFWESIPKANLILGARTVRTLTWRYADHPHVRFLIGKMMKSDELAGYLVFYYSLSDSTFYIYDLAVSEQKDLLCMLGLFLEYCTRQREAGNVRIVLSERHPYCGLLWKLGFVPRSDVGTFHVKWPNGSARENRPNWSMSLGDKDV
jgi:GNAT superfamily N-acetyltransferase